MNLVKLKKKGRNLFNINKFIISPYYIILIILVVIPMLLMVLYSLQQPAEQGLLYTKFSFVHFSNYLTNFQLLKATIKSIMLAFYATIITLLIGYPLAYFISQRKARTQALLIVLITGTIWVNMILRTYALVQVFDMIIKFSIFGMTPFAFLKSYLIEHDVATIIGLVYIYLPFMVLPIYTILSKIDKSLIEGAYDLGANRVQTFRKVILPLSLSGVISGIILVFLPAVTTIVIPAYLGPSIDYSIAQIIEARVRAGNIGDINSSAAIGVVLAVVLLVLMAIIKKFDRYKGIGELNED